MCRLSKLGVVASIAVAAGGAAWKVWQRRQKVRKSAWSLLLPDSRSVASAGSTPLLLADHGNLVQRPSEARSPAASRQPQPEHGAAMQLPGQLTSPSSPARFAADKAAFDSSFVRVQRLPCFFSVLQSCQASMSDMSRTPEHVAVALLDRTIRDAHIGLLTIRACIAAGDRLPAGSLEQEKRQGLLRLKGLAEHHRATGHALRRDIRGGHSHLATCWVVNLKWRLTAGLAAALRAVVAPPHVPSPSACARDWDQAMRLWFPDACMTTLMHTASGSGRYV